MGVFDFGGADSNGHEQVVFGQDRRSGLKAIVGIYSTALGPALGGARFYPYESEDAALADVLKLSRGMAYKNAVAGLDYGGGKAVIWGDPERMKTEGLLRAYGRFVQSLGGRYYTASDVGTYVSDMDVVARETRFVVGRSPEDGGSGDSSILTAWSVFQGMRAAAEHAWGRPTLGGRTVGIAGLGKVGRYLARHLIEDGAAIVATDVNEAALRWARTTYPQIEIVADAQALITSDIDVYAPCALSGALDEETVGQLRARIVTGAANNQLAHPGIEKTLTEQNILYAPDYVVNAGGVIQAADEIDGFNFERAKLRATGVFETTKRILRIADDQGVSPAVAADRLAEERIAQNSHLR